MSTPETLSVDIADDDAEPALAFLGKAIPLARLREHYKKVPAGAGLFGDNALVAEEPSDSEALAHVFHHSARRAFSSVLSLEIIRKRPRVFVEQTESGLVPIPYYRGPVSGVLVSAEGYIVTSLHNLASLNSVLPPGPSRLRPPKGARVSEGILSIARLMVHLPEGDPVEAKVIARHERLGIALIKAEIGPERDVVPAVPAPASVSESGRFVLALGNPFGTKRREDPLLTIGVLSKRHSPGGADPWTTQWQTDAGLTDANAGGAAVDLRGRLSGVTTIWSVLRHGRNSGVGFIVPWSEIERVLPDLKRGHNFQMPSLGITWRHEHGIQSRIVGIVHGGTAAKGARIKAGDVLLEIDGLPIRDASDVHRVLSRRFAGDEIALRVRRGSESKSIAVTLGALDEE